MNPTTSEEDEWESASRRLAAIKERMAEFEDRIAMIPGVNLGGPKEKAEPFENDDFMKSLTQPD
jgi:hypothetical protein